MTILHFCIIILVNTAATFFDKHFNYRQLKLPPARNERRFRVMKEGGTCVQTVTGENKTRSSQNQKKDRTQIIWIYKIAQIKKNKKSM